MPGPSEHVLRSAAVENYLKTIFSIVERADSEQVSTSALADRLGLSPSSVSGMVRRLAQLGLVEHLPYGRITLTADGQQAALQVVRRHRLLEMYLVAELGYRWDEVHDEAEELEHVVSDVMVARMDAKLGHPISDPHGDPIPSPDGTIRALGARRLSTLTPGASGMVVRVDDLDPAVLRALAGLGVGLGRRIELVSLSAAGCSVAVDGVHQHLAGSLAGAIWIG